MRCDRAGGWGGCVVRIWAGGGEGARFIDGELLIELGPLSRKLEAIPESVTEFAFTDSVEVIEPETQKNGDQDYVTLEMATVRSRMLTGKKLTTLKVNRLACSSPPLKPVKMVQKLN